MPYRRTLIAAGASAALGGGLLTYQDLLWKIIDQLRNFSVVGADTQSATGGWNGGPIIAPTVPPGTAPGTAPGDKGESDQKDANPPKK